MPKKPNPSWLLILAVTIGGILEWYEIGLYIYWPLIILSDYFTIEMPLAEAINTVLVIATGLIARPLGGIIFGRWGDIRGRKTPFTWSIVFVAIPSLLIGILPSYMVWSVFSLIFFTIIKFFQGIPAGGELPGAICYLFEARESTKRQYLCSFTFVGPQLGLLLSLCFCFLLKLSFNEEELMRKWWRVIFLFSGLIGLAGFVLRTKLHESFDFSHLHTSHITHPIKQLFIRCKDSVKTGIVLSLFQVSTFCILTIMPAWYYRELFGLTDQQNLLINTLILTCCVFLLPFFGKISSHLKWPFLDISAWGTIIFAYPFYLSIKIGNLIITIIIQMILVLLYSMQSALLPSLIASLFPTSLRYTGIGCSFNIVDGVLWGLIPILSTILERITGTIAYFSLFLPMTAAIFIIYLHKHKRLKKKS